MERCSIENQKNAKEGKVSARGRIFRAAALVGLLMVFAAAVRPCPSYGAGPPVIQSVAVDLNRRHDPGEPGKAAGLETTKRPS